MLAKSILPDQRRAKLRAAVNQTAQLGRAIRLMEVHNGLSALVANDTVFTTPEGETRSFDGLWVSGLCESASRGLPDIELQGMLSRVAVVREIVGVTDKPIVVDGDTGGSVDQLQYLVRTLEGYGVSALVIEDKVFPKNNSFEFDKSQELEKPETFARKIELAKSAQLSRDFMLIARTEALIAGRDIDEALKRAEIYALAGADAIVIHSRQKTADQVLEFSRRFSAICAKHDRKIPLVSIPTTYNSISEAELYHAGFHVVIHANHLLRSALQAMTQTAQTILSNGRSLEVEPRCTSLSTLLGMIEKAQTNPPNDK